MAFKENDVDMLLTRCHRRCCVCHRFCGTKIEVHHVKHRSKGGTDESENAIPLCFDCHAEVHSVNDGNRGRRFTAKELLSHRDQWLAICSKSPQVLIAAPPDATAGPLQGMIDELEYNLVVAKFIGSNDLGARFLDQQFLRAVSLGSISMLDDETKRLVYEAYRHVSLANGRVERALSATHPAQHANALGNAQTYVGGIRPYVEKALARLTSFAADAPGAEGEGSE